MEPDERKFILPFHQRPVLSFWLLLSAMLGAASIAQDLVYGARNGGMHYYGTIFWAAIFTWLLYKKR